MKYRSLNQPTTWRTFGQALREGLAPNRGLYVPESIPVLRQGFIENTTLQEIGFTMMLPLVGNDLSKAQVQGIVEDALDFEIPLVDVKPGLSLLELFHGPTAAFKDVGARMMSRFLQHVSNDRLTVLVATSGDTGSAVAQGFLDVDGIDVVILYPSGRISRIQEQQLTTVGRNVSALEIAGSFDDCQAMVKSAFQDEELQRFRPLTSANSINIGRWLPQSIYYAWAAAQSDRAPRFVIPSGNFGNAAAGKLAQKMGVSRASFVAAVNANRTMQDYLRSGNYDAKASVQTISNAMDVGDPSNRPRLEWLYNGSFKEMQQNFSVLSVDDNSTKRSMQEMSERYDLLVCPHTAVGIHAAKNAGLDADDAHSTIVLATAHAAKFGEVVLEATGKEPKVPESLKSCLDKTKDSVGLPATYDALKAFLMESGVQ
jgi:threonine synthase